MTSTRLRAAAGALLVSIPLCALDELHKLMIPDRHCRWDEAALNLLGAALGIDFCLAASAIGDAVRRSKCP